jgi:hypothetical protein
MNFTQYILLNQQAAAGSRGIIVRIPTAREVKEKEWMIYTNVNFASIQNFLCILVFLITANNEGKYEILRIPVRRRILILLSA